jgi:hypothetical protein
MPLVAHRDLPVEHADEVCRYGPFGFYETCQLRQDPDGIVSRRSGRVRATLQWLGRSALALLTALPLLGLGFYLHFLWSGPPLESWRRARLDAREGPSLPRPAHLVLVSPAIGVTRLAAIGRIRTGLSEVPGFGRAAWQLIEPELDPYKYRSFPFHAAGTTQKLTSTLTRRVTRLVERGPVRADCRRSSRSSRRWTRPWSPRKWSTRCSDSSRPKAASSCCST